MTSHLGSFLGCEEEKIQLPESDEAPVLHGAGREIGQCHQVDFGQRELHLEVAFQELEHRSRHLDSQFGLIDHVTLGPDPHGRRRSRCVAGVGADLTRYGRRFTELKVGDEAGHQVRGHGHRFLVIIPEPSVFVPPVKKEQQMALSAGKSVANRSPPWN